MTRESSEDKKQDTEDVRDMGVRSKTYFEHRNSNCSIKIYHKKRIINRWSKSSIMSFSKALLSGTEVSGAGERYKLSTVSTCQTET